MDTPKLSNDYAPLSEGAARNEAASVGEHSEKLTKARRRLFPHALLVGLATGLLAVAFRLALEKGEAARDFLIGHAQGGGGFLLLVLMTSLFIGGALWLVQAVCPEAVGSGIPHLRLILRENGRLRWWRILPVKFLSGVLGIIGGLCLGREGPTIQMGAALGAMWGGSQIGKGADKRSLLVTGASAGLAAAFNAPMAGILFAIEELRINIPDSTFFSALVACVSADLVARIFLGQIPVLQVTLAQIPPLDSLPFFIILGALLGLLSWVFNKSLVYISSLLAFKSPTANILKVVIAGVALAIVGWNYPALLGGGIHLSNRTLNADGTIAWLAAMFVLRFLLSIGSYGVGTAGGIFAPLLVLGGLFGLLIGKLSQDIFPAAVPEPAAFAVVGMAAAFAGIVRCPLTGVVLIIEMTGHYELILPLMVASFTATFVADETGVQPIYDALLENQLTHHRL
ncbi:MAG: H(+)/Cl(-) exchange transporter ClcA [Planctomycetales bacterium]|nr:H(+)/Cl(-) exchange transporter ClcA [Planctomycetales bacterium]